MAKYVCIQDFVVEKPTELRGNYWQDGIRPHSVMTDRDNTDQRGCSSSEIYNVTHIHADVRADADGYTSKAMTDRGDGNRNGCTAMITDEDIESMESACPYDELIRKLIEREQNYHSNDHVLSW